MSDANMVVINDSNWTAFANDSNPTRARGYQGMWENDGLKAAAKGFGELVNVPLIPRSEWGDRARQRESDQTRLKDFCLGSGLTVLNQQSTNYCWINAPVFCCMVTRLKETGQLVRLSPASAGARIKNFRNVGGWGSEGLNWMVEHGVNLQSDWPANSISRNYDTPENREKAKLNRIVEYFRLDNWDEVASCILAGIPVACGYNWWRHEVTGMDLTPSGDLIIANSWGNWGDQGYGVLQGSKKDPDDAVAIVSMQAA